jgi:transposase
MSAAMNCGDLTNELGTEYIHLKQFHRIAARYEKRAISYSALLTSAATVLWLRSACTP